MVAGLAVWGVALRRTKLTDEQVPLFLSTSAPAPPLEQGAIGPNHRHRPKTIRPLCPPVDGVDTVDSGGHGGQLGGVWNFQYFCTYTTTLHSRTLF